MSESLEEMIQRHEGCRHLPYQDSLGVWTVGYGHNLEQPLSHAAVLHIFRDDLNEAMNNCLHAFPWFADLTPARAHALIDMCFNLGLPRFQKFAKFLKAMEQGEYETAANEMLESLWAKQVKSRALELAAMIRGSDAL